MEPSWKKNSSSQHWKNVGKENVKKKSLHFILEPVTDEQVRIFFLPLYKCMHCHWCKQEVDYLWRQSQTRLVLEETSLTLTRKWQQVLLQKSCKGGIVCIYLLRSSKPNIDFFDFFLNQTNFHFTYLIAMKQNLLFHIQNSMACLNLSDDVITSC